MIYKNLLIGYINERKDGSGQYLVITNVDTEDLVLKAGEKIYLNRTPKHVLAKSAHAPHFSKSIKVEDEPTIEKEEIVDPNDVPF